MKSRINKDKCSHESEHGDLTSHLHSDNRSDAGSVKNIKKSKRVAHSSCEDDDSSLGNKEQKHKSKKGRLDMDTVLTSGVLTEKEQTFQKSDKEASEPDSNMKSNKKKKKTKKQKAAINLANSQPNTSTLDYLKKWKSDQGNWKFEKVKQNRLVSNMFDNEKLPADYFSIFLEYMEGGSKSMKEFMSKLAKEVVDEMEKRENMDDGDKEITPKIDQEKYQRARTVLQSLE